MQTIVDRLAGQRAGLREAVEKLRRDPCAAGGYKLVGPLRDRVCGLHMRRDYRLAYTILTARRPTRGSGEGTVAVLAIGRKEADTRRGLPAALELVHDILGESWAPGSLERTPCCEARAPRMDEADVEDAMPVLRRLLRGR